MILTVTMNTSVDITYVMETLKTDAVNRVSDVRKAAGGKGLNVTRVLKQTGEDVTASGLVGGTTGSFIKKELAGQGIPCRFLETGVESRNNISILHGGTDMEILEKGNPVGPETADAFADLYKGLLEDADIVTISGSLPPGLPPDYYGRLVKIAAEKGKKVLLDTSGVSLKEALACEAKPFLIKPNEDELEALTGSKVDPEDAAGLRKLLRHPLLENIPMVMVSLGAAGALVRCDDQIFRALVPRVPAVNPIGSGDSVIAGLAAGLCRGEDTETILRRGMTYGVLNALDPLPGHLDMTHFQEIYNQIKIQIER